VKAQLLSELYRIRRLMEGMTVGPDGSLGNMYSDFNDKLEDLEVGDIVEIHSLGVYYVIAVKNHPNVVTLSDEPPPYKTGQKAWDLSRDMKGLRCKIIEKNQPAQPEKLDRDTINNFLAECGKEIAARHSRIRVGNYTFLFYRSEGMSGWEWTWEREGGAGAMVVELTPFKEYEDNEGEPRLFVHVSADIPDEDEGINEFDDVGLPEEVVSLVKTGGIAAVIEFVKDIYIPIAEQELERALGHAGGLQEDMRIGPGGDLEGFDGEVPDEPQKPEGDPNVHPHVEKITKLMEHVAKEIDNFQNFVEVEGKVFQFHFNGGILADDEWEWILEHDTISLTVELTPFKDGYTPVIVQHIYDEVGNNERDVIPMPELAMSLAKAYKGNYQTVKRFVDVVYMPIVRQVLTQVARHID